MVITTNQTDETEANLFAMELLMPEPLVREAMKKWTHWDVEGLEIRKLSARFRVSDFMMTLRLVQLGFFKGLVR